MPSYRNSTQETRFRRFFPASRYNDPRGGRASSLERNILRYRAAEAALYLFYAENVRDFMLANVYPRTVAKNNDPWEPSQERQRAAAFHRVLMDAKIAGTLSEDDAEAIRLSFENDRQQGKKLKAAFAYSIGIGMLSDQEAMEIKELLDYRNEIAHRIHRVMSDVSRSYANSELLDFRPPTYKDDALGRLRAFHKTLWERSHQKLILFISFDRLIFEFAERVYEDELKRLDRLIKSQIKQERRRIDALNVELDLRGTELVGDLAPWFPANHRPARYHGDDHKPPSGHLTTRGVEICFRLFDLGKSTIAVAYLMGITIRSTERRRQQWVVAGGCARKRINVKRYDPNTMRELVA